MTRARLSVRFGSLGFFLRRKRRKRERGLFRRAERRRSVWISRSEPVFFLVGPLCKICEMVVSDWPRRSSLSKKNVLARGSSGKGAKECGTNHNSVHHGCYRLHPHRPRDRRPQGGRPPHLRARGRLRPPHPVRLLHQGVRPPRVRFPATEQSRRGARVSRATFSDACARPARRRARDASCQSERARRRTPRRYVDYATRDRCAPSPGSGDGPRADPVAPRRARSAPRAP